MPPFIRCCTFFIDSMFALLMLRSEKVEKYGVMKQEHYGTDFMIKVCVTVNIKDARKIGSYASCNMAFISNL